MEDFNIILELADTSVAVRTKKPSDPASFVAMINRKSPNNTISGSRFWTFANGANSALTVVKFGIFLLGYAKLPAYFIPSKLFGVFLPPQLVSFSELFGVLLPLLFFASAILFPYFVGVAGGICCHPRPMFSPLNFIKRWGSFRRDFSNYNIRTSSAHNL